MDGSENQSARRRLKRFRVGTTLLALILSVLLPVLAAEVFIYSARFERRIAEERNANREVASAFGKTFEAFIQDILRREKAVALLFGRGLPTIEVAQKMMEESSRDYAAMLDFTWIDPQGRALASSNSRNVGADFSSRPFFQQMDSGADWVVSDLMESTQEGEHIFLVVRPVREADGLLLGYLVARVVPDRLDAVLAIERPRQGKVCLLDSRGMLVYSYPREKISPKERDWSEGAESPGIMKSRAFPILSPELDRRISAHAHIPSIGWRAVASRSSAEVVGPISRDLAWSGSILLFVALCAFLFSWVLSRRISGPIRRLQSYALGVARGEQGMAAPEPAGPSEVQDLTSVFLEAERTLRLSEENLKRQLMEQKRSEEQLRESEERHRSIFENSLDGILLANLEGSIVAANPVACAMHGYTEPEICGLGREGIAVRDHKLRRVIDERSRTGKYRGEVDHVRKDGTRFPCELSTAVFKDKHGLEATVVILRDITERKMAEEALNRAKEELEHRVIERTAELEQKNRELQDFVFIASHDLKEPLRKIQVFGDLVMTKYGGSLHPDCIDHLCRMQDSAARMEALLESLLAYSRLTTGAQPFHQVDLNEAARRAESNLEILIRQTGGKIEIDPLPCLEGDFVQLVQLLQNLFGNALKFHPDGVKPHIRVYSRTAEVGGRQRSYEICVEDNGIGFDEKYLEKVFMPFQRLHGRGEYEGVGMGLAICRKIVDRHGGTITAKSRPNDGAIFIVSLPAANNCLEPANPEGEKTPEKPAHRAA